MDAVMAVKIGYILLWTVFAGISLWISHRDGVRSRLRLQRKRAHQGAP